MAALLRNISIFVEKFNIETLEHHKRWFDDGFDLLFEIDNNEKNYKIDIKYNENYDDLINLQDKYKYQSQNLTIRNKILKLLLKQIPKWLITLARRTIFISKFFHKGKY